MNPRNFLHIFALSFAVPLFAIEPCRIQIIEKDSHWPVPLVRLETTSQQIFVSDNAGIIAFDAPEFFGKETWFEIKSDGYERKKDGFGYRGVRMTPTAGGRLKIEVERTNIAKRLGRLTGAGIFAESQKCGEFLTWKESGITGQDTVQLAEYKGKLHWGWGDTNLPHYPLGIYNGTGATTPLHPLEKPEPPVSLVFNYHRDKDGRPKGILPKNEGPNWVTAYATLPDAQKREHFVCTYIKVKGTLEVVETGLAEWNDTAAKFEEILLIWKKSDGNPKPILPEGHAVISNDTDGKRRIYFGDGLPKMCCPATYEAWKNPDTWEKVENPKKLEDANSDRKVEIASGAIAWNNYRKRWVAILSERYGKPSFLGEIWYAEGMTPTGPWGRAVKILSHENYSFYNPLIHAELSPENSPVLLFEGTYTAQFSGNPTKTPRYDYNQILYRLDLNDTALAPAQK